jgi:hypothetical protein
MLAPDTITGLHESVNTLTIPPQYATDSEWQGRTWISIAVLDPYDVVTVYINWDVTTAEVRWLLERHAEELGVLVHFGTRRPDHRLVPERCNLLMFFSPKDVRFALGETKFVKDLLAGKISQRNALFSQRGYGVKLYDLFGLSGKQKLEKMATALGIEMDAKNSMDIYKKVMINGLIFEPEMFLDYAVQDVTVLPKIYKALLNVVRGIEADLGIPQPKRATAATLPHTLGSTVAKIFHKWLFAQAGPYADAVRFSTFKLGILDQDHPNYESNRQKFHETCQAYRSPEALAVAGTSKRQPFRANHFRYSALECCGVRYFAGRDEDESEIFNAPVCGGRCVNERPEKLLVGPGLDIDIAAFYATIMSRLTYPLGLPYVWSYSANRKHTPTLEEFLNQNQGELVPGLFTITVAGELPFYQDMLFSKLARADNIHRALLPNDNGDTREIDAALVLARRELYNTVLTHHELKTIQAVATNQEWRAFQQVRVITAAAYRRCDRLDNAEAWCRHIMAEPVDFDSETTTTGVRPVDQRARAWYGIKLRDFIGKLKADRARFKKIAADTGTSDEERQRAGGMQYFIKLIMNSLYGVKASRHFPISNVVVANNITAAARLGMWQLAKALALAQSITDGGIYQPSHVLELGRYKPGLESLATMHEQPNRDSIHTVPLAGIQDWPERIREGRVPSDIDEIALHHVKGVWANYGLKFPYNLEHKRENDFLQATTAFSKADYTLELVGGGRKYKLRGKDKEKKDDPKFHIHDELLDGGDCFPTGEEMLSCRKGILSIKQWRRMQSYKNADRYAHLLPGDDYETDKKPARFNNLWAPCDTVEQYRRRARRGQRSKTYAVLFERHANNDAGKGIRWVHQKMLRDQL